MESALSGGHSLEPYSFAKPAVYESPMNSILRSGGAGGGTTVFPLSSISPPKKEGELDSERFLRSNWWVLSSRPLAAMIVSVWGRDLMTATGFPSISTSKRSFPLRITLQEVPWNAAPIYTPGHSKATSEGFEKSNLPKY